MSTAPQPDGTRPTARLSRAAGEVALTIGAVLGLLCLLSTVAAVAFDVRPVIFRSGSMSPAIETGALAFSRTVPASDLAKGDVVTVTNSKGITVTHRIESLTRTGDEATLVLRGDANEVSDSESYVVAQAPRVIFDVPRLGYVVSAMSGPWGVFAAGLVVGLVLTAAFSRRRSDEDDDVDVDRGDEGSGPDNDLDGAGDTFVPAAWTTTADRTDELASAGAQAPRARDSRRRLVLAVVIVAAVAAAMGSISSTSAAWLDTATVNSGTFSQKVPDAVTITGCTTSGNSLTITWTAPVSPTTWEFRYVYSTPAGQTEVDSFAGNLRSRTSTTNLNNKAGTLTLVGLFPGGIERTSFTYAFSGNGSNRTCTLVP